MPYTITLYNCHGDPDGIKSETVESDPRTAASVMLDEWLNPMDRLIQREIAPGVVLYLIIDQYENRPLNTYAVSRQKGFEQ